MSHCTQFLFAFSVPPAPSCGEECEHPEEICLATSRSADSRANLCGSLNPFLSVSRALCPPWCPCSAWSSAFCSPALCPLPCASVIECRLPVALEPTLLKVQDIHPRRARTVVFSANASTIGTSFTPTVGDGNSWLLLCKAGFDLTALIASCCIAMCACMKPSPCVDILSLRYCWRKQRTCFLTGWILQVAVR